jgi:uncharacterized membrane protein YqiK
MVSVAIVHAANLLVSGVEIGDDPYEQQLRADAAERRAAALAAENEELRRRLAKRAEDEARAEAADRAEADADRVRVGRRNANIYVVSMVALAAGGAAFEYLRGELVGAAVAGFFALAFLVIGVGLAVLGERPPEGFVLVLTGRRYPRGDGKTAPYRVVVDRWVTRVPIIERSDLLDCRRRWIDVRVVNAYAKGNTPLTIEARASYELGRHEPEVDHAIERFLGRSMTEVDTVVRETLEGHVRGRVAELTEDEIRHGHEAFAALIVEEADFDARELGVQLHDLDIGRVRAPARGG